MKRPIIKRPTRAQIQSGIKNIRPFSRIDYFVEHHVKWFTFLIGLLIMWRFIVECQNENYTVVPVSVPVELEKRGYNSGAVTDKIFEEIRKVTDLKPSASSRGAVLLNLMGFNQTSIVRLEDNYDGGTFDLKNLFKAAKTLVNVKDRAVVGHIVETEAPNGRRGLALFLKINNKAIPSSLSVEHVSKIDSLLRMAATDIVQYTHPDLLIRKYLADQNKQKANEVYELSKFRLHTQYNEREDASRQIQETTTEIYSILYDIDTEKYMQGCEKALSMCADLKRRFPRDIAPYVLEVSILKSAALHLHDYISADDPRIIPFCLRGIEVVKAYERKWFKRSAYFDENRALGILYTSYAYCMHRAKTNSEERIKAVFDKAITYLPDNSHVYNDLIYFYLDNKHYAQADSMARYILGHFPMDNNLWDTRAEISYRQNNMREFYFSLQKAVERPDTALGFTAENYLRDIRWKEQWTKQEYLQALGIVSRNVIPAALSPE